MFSDRLKSIAYYPALDRFLAGFLLMMAAIVIGYFTAVWAIGATRPVANDIYGPWKLQTLGGKTIDTPYSEARLAREGPFVLPQPPPIFQCSVAVVAIGWQLFALRR